MKTVFVTLLMTAFSSSAFAVPVAFEREYVNQAWGFQTHGCMIDEMRWVYKYSNLSPVPMRAVNRVPGKEFKAAKKLVHKMINQKGKFSQKQVSADAGDQTWIAFHDFGMKRTALKRTGDYVGQHSSKEATDLVVFMEKWCK